MEELTTEQKAQRYDEALVWMQDLYPTMEGAMREDAKHYFPQLKESKDEKIRKEIINFIKISKPEWENYSDYSSWIAWLEKQGDNPTPINIDKMVMEYSQTKDSDFGLPVNCMIRAYRQGIIDVLNLSSGIEKQDKQILANSTKTCNDEHKNVEWHREDEQNLNACLGYIPDEYLRRWLTDAIHAKYDKPADKVEPKFKVGDTIKCKYDDRQFTIKSVDLDKGTYTYTQEGCGNDIDYADENFELVEQNPTEWSEDDESIALGIEQIVDCASLLNIAPDKLYKIRNWLKLLKDRVGYEANCTTTKQRSEDEESIINTAESWLDTLCDYLKDSSPEYISDIKDVINRLKSLKDRIGG